ncbi:hypothetical protein D3C86_2113180 [compost metagenome]
MPFFSIFLMLEKELPSNPNMIKLNGAIMKLNLNIGAMVLPDTQLLMQVCAN